MFAGPNGSGKSSLYARLVEEGHFHPATFINADEIQQDLDSGSIVNFPLVDAHDFMPRLRKSSFLSHGLASREIDALVGDPVNGLSLRPHSSCGPYLAAAIADSLRSQFIQEQHSFAFETVMSHESKLDLLAASRAAGYRNYLYFVTTGDPMLNVERVRQRIAEGGHPVSREKVLDRYKRCMELLPRALDLCDRAYLFDNSGTESLLVATVLGGTTLRSTSTSVPKWLGDLLSSIP